MTNQVLKQQNMNNIYVLMFNNVAETQQKKKNFGAQCLGF